MPSRRTILGMIGASPVAGPAMAQAAIGAIDLQPPAHPFPTGAVPGAVPAGDNRALLRRALQLGIVSEEEARDAILADAGVSIYGGNQDELDTYKSLAQHTRDRIRRERAREREWSLFVTDTPRGYRVMERLLERLANPAREGGKP